MPRRRGGGGSGGASAHGASSGSGASSETPEALIDEGHFFMAQDMPNRAVDCFRRAAALRPDDADLLDALGDACLAAGDVDGANEALMKSAELAPDGGAAKWMQLGQLRSGAEARDAFKRGIAVLERERARGDDSRRVDIDDGGAAACPTVSVSSELASAYCALAELYMTDCADEEDALAHAEEALDAATVACPHSPDPYFGRANLRMLQGRRDDANAEAERAMEAVRRLAERDEEQPSYGVRLALARLLMELERFSDAAELCDLLLAEDDGVMEVWYIMGEACRETGDFAGGVEFVSQALSTVEELRGVEDSKELRTQRDKFKALLKALEEELAAAGGAVDDVDDEEGADAGADADDVKSDAHSGDGDGVVGGDGHDGDVEM